MFWPSGQRATCGKDILDVESSKYKALWSASTSQPSCTYDGNTPHPRPTPAQLRRISKTFKKRTGVAPDQWHPRHFALLSDELPVVLAMLFELLERSGHLPGQQRQVYIFLFKTSWGDQADRSLHCLLSCLVQDPPARGSAMDCGQRPAFPSGWAGPVNDRPCVEAERQGPGHHRARPPRGRCLLGCAEDLRADGL